MFSSCIKDLEEEGIFETTTIKGSVLEEGKETPIINISVKLTDGVNVPQNTFTDNNGEFTLSVTNEQISKGFYISIEADSIYTPKTVKLDAIKYGSKDFDIGTIYIIGANLPIVTTKALTNITATSVQTGGEVQDDGKSFVTTRGVCISVNQYPTINDMHTTDGNGTGEFISIINNLTENTLYYIRAYATNGTGTAYGEQIAFTTADGLPTIITGDITDIAATSIACSGNVTDDGGFAVTEKGVCWSTTMNPTITNNHTTDGNGIGKFVSNVTNLHANTTYFIRAYAKNKAGISYGEQKIFTTLSGLPTVTTDEVTNITSSSATCGGYITLDGGFSVTARGVCISTSPNPTINNTHTNDGTGTGKFISYLTNLSSNTTYYIRAYATNSAGTSYGKEISFTTK